MGHLNESIAISAEILCVSVEYEGIVLCNLSRFERIQMSAKVRNFVC